MNIIIVSAFLYSIPFFFPVFSPLLFVFMIPLLFRSLHTKITFKDGVLWGLIIYSLHFVWLANLVMSKGIGSLKFLLFLLVVGWFSLWTGVWFLVQGLFQDWLRVRINNFITFVLSWFIPTMFYFYFVLRASLLLGGVWEGYPFINPFVPLANYISLLSCMYYIGLWGALSCLILFQVFITVVLFEKEVLHVRYALIVLAPFVLSFFLCSSSQISMSNMYFLNPEWCLDTRSKDPVFTAYRMVHAVTHIACDNQCVEVIVMPESTFGWDLYEYQKFIPMLCECIDDCVIVFGAQRRVGCGLRNSCFALQQGSIVFVYDKIHLVPLVERIPLLLCYCFGEMFTSFDNVFTYGDSEQNDVIYFNGQQFQIFMCSELFGEAKPIKGLPILFLCNESWLSCDYAKSLSRLFVKYISVLHGVPILISSFT